MDSEETTIQYVTWWFDPSNIPAVGFWIGQQNAFSPFIVVGQ
jgi:hypothetical protein